MNPRGQDGLSEEAGQEFWPLFRIKKKILYLVVAGLVQATACKRVLFREVQTLFR